MLQGRGKGNREASSRVCGPGVQAIGEEPPPSSVTWERRAGSLPSVPDKHSSMKRVLESPEILGVEPRRPLRLARMGQALEHLGSAAPQR